MRVQFDYLTGPVLGHLRRCRILEQALWDSGHESVVYDADWLVVDYPEIPKRPDWAKRRLVMGNIPQEDGDYAWAPIYDPWPNTLTGREYLLLDPILARYKDLPHKNEYLVTCGGADPLHLTEQLLPMLSGGTVIIGPGFNREVLIPSNWTAVYAPAYPQMLELLATHDTTVCAWGNTVFELCYLGSRFLPIATWEDHVREANWLGTPILRPDELERVPLEVGKLQTKDYGIDLRGAERVIEFMVSKL